MPRGQVPRVRGKERSRRNSGAWRAKRSDAGKARGKKDAAGCPVMLLATLSLLLAVALVAHRIL